MTTERNTDATSEHEAEGHIVRWGATGQDQVGDEPEIEGHVVKWDATGEAGAESADEDSDSAGSSR